MKRLISLCVSFVILCSFSICCVFADSTEPKESTFELLEALGIDKDVNANDAEIITRAEFVAMAVRCLNTEGADMYDASFSDVDRDDLFAKEIYEAKALRMSNGTAEGVFSPGETVTVPVALKIMLTAMGYESVAQAKGGYPSGYMSVESKVKLLKGVEAEGELTVHNAKTIMENALKADILVIDGVSGEMITYENNKGKNLLTENFHLKKTEGVVTTADYLTLDTSSAKRNTLCIAGKTFKCDIPAEKYFGMDVTAYYSEKTDEISVIEADKINEEITIAAKDVISYKNNELEVFDGSDIVSYRTDAALSFMKNGRLIAHTDADFKFNDGTIRLIDNDGDGEYEIAMAEKLQYFVISGINAATKTIYDKNSPIGSICFEDKSTDKDIVCRLLDEEGNSVNFDALRKNDVLRVSVSDDETIYIVRAGGSRIISDKLTEITEDGIKIGEEEYKTNDYFKLQSITLNVGWEYDFVIASDLTVTNAVFIEASDISYGYFLAHNIEGNLTKTFSIKLLTQNGDVEIFDLADKIVFDGERNVKCTDPIIEAAFTNGEYPKYQVIRYMTNDDNKISLIDTASEEVNSTWELPTEINGKNTLTQYLSQKEVNYRGGATFGAPYFSFLKGIIFAVPEALMDNPNQEYDEELFRVMDVSELKNNVDYYADIYDFDAYYYPQAITMYTEVTAGGAANVKIGNASHIVCSVTYGIDENGTDTRVIRTFSRGRYYRYLVDPDEVNSLTIPKAGDIVRMDVNRFGKIVGMTIDAEYSELNKGAEIKYSSGYTEELSYIAGRVKTLGNEAITLKASSAAAANLLPSLVDNVAPLPMESTSYTIFDTQTGEVKRGFETDIIGENVAGIANASKVVCRLKYYEVTDVFIYVD